MVAYDQGVRVLGISIVPDGGRMGRVSIDTLYLNRLVPTFRHNKGARNRLTMERHVMVLQGGTVAVRRLCPESTEVSPTANGEGSDQNIAMNLLRSFATGDLEAGKYYQWLEARTQGITANPMRWHQVRMLAEALLEHEELGARKVRDVIREAGEEWCRENNASDI